MNGPRVVCAGCNKPTSIFKPVCDECMALIEYKIPAESLQKLDALDRAAASAKPPPKAP